MSIVALMLIANWRCIDDEGTKRHIGVRAVNSAVTSAFHVLIFYKIILPRIFWFSVKTIDAASGSNTMFIHLTKYLSLSPASNLCDKRSFTCGHLILCKSCADLQCSLNLNKFSYISCNQLQSPSTKLQIARTVQSWAFRASSTALCWSWKLCRLKCLLLS